MSLTYQTVDIPKNSANQIAFDKVTSDQPQNNPLLEPSALLACHILHYLFTSAPKPLVYQRTTTDRRMITATFRYIGFSTFLLALKCLFLLSKRLVIVCYIISYLDEIIKGEKNKPAEQKPASNSNNSSSRINKTNSSSASNLSAQVAAAAAAAAAAASSSSSRLFSITDENL